MPTKRPTPPRRHEPDPAALAAALGTEPSETERAAGYRTPADRILAVADRGGHWSVVTIDGGKHCVAKGAA